MNAKEKQIYPPPFPGIVISSAKGVNLYDKKNKKKYTDLSGAAGMACIGYGNSKIKSIIKKQADGLLVSPQKYQTKEAETLKNKILGLMPSYDTVVPCVTGSETLEVALQISINYTGNNNFLSFDKAYHGHTLAAGSLGEGDYNYGFFKNKFETVAIPQDKEGAEKIIKAFKEKLSRKKYAAVVLEGVVTNAGYIKPPSEFYLQIKKICSENNVLLIFDEVLTGFGRTGKMFSYNHHKIFPDIICMAKGLSSGYCAIGAVVTTEKIVKNYDYLATFAWLPLSCSIASANLDIIVKNQLPEKSRELGKYAMSLLHNYLLDCPLVKNIRGVGLGIAIELEEREYVSRVYEACLSRGIILFKNPYSKMLFIQPPLIIKKNELESSIKKVISGIIDVYKQKHEV